MSEAGSTAGDAASKVAGSFETYASTQRMSTSRWKPLWVDEAALFDEGVVEAVLAVRFARSRGRPGGDMGRQRSGFERCV